MPRCLPWERRSAARLLFACFTGFSSLFATMTFADAGAREAPRAARVEQPERDEFWVNVPVHSRVTQRFEIYNPHSLEQLRAIKQMGFTQVILDWPNLHSAATELGLEVVLANWWTPQNESETLEKGIENAKRVDRRRLRGVSMMDEPERNSPNTPFSYYEALYVDLRDRFDQELPGVSLEISHWGPLKSWPAERYEEFVPLYRATDLIRLMPYPDLYESPLNDVFFQMMRSRHVMELAERTVPQVVILQTWVLPENPKLPTIDELRVMAYQAMLTGADTLSFFTYDPDLWERTSPGYTEQFTELMRELVAFSQRYRTAMVETRMSSTGVLTATLAMPGCAPQEITVNTNRNALGDLGGLHVAGPMASAVSSIATSQVPRPRRVHSGRRWRTGGHVWAGRTRNW